MKRLICSILVCVAVFGVVGPYSARAVQESGLSQAARDAGNAYLRAMAAAGAAFARRDFATALDKLDLADQIAPNIVDTWNLRGAIYAEEHAYEEADDAFEKAASLSPGDFWPPYNLAELLMMQKKYGPAADAFGKLEVYGGHEELVGFKIVFADLMGGKPDAAKPVLDAMKFPSNTPAYYFAYAAWSFAHNDAKEGTYWTNEAIKVFGPGPCVSFYQTLADAGWLPKLNPDGTIPDKIDLSALPSATPGVDAPAHAGVVP